MEINAVVFFHIIIRIIEIILNFEVKETTYLIFQNYKDVFNLLALKHISEDNLVRNNYFIKKRNLLVVICRSGQNLGK